MNFDWILPHRFDGFLLIQWSCHRKPKSNIISMQILQRRSLSIQRVLRANGEWLWSQSGAAAAWICMRYRTNTTHARGFSRDTHPRQISNRFFSLYILKRSTSLNHIQKFNRATIKLVVNINESNDYNSLLSGSETWMRYCSCNRV